VAGGGAVHHLGWDAVEAADGLDVEALRVDELGLVGCDRDVAVLGAGEDGGAVVALVAHLPHRHDLVGAFLLEPGIIGLDDAGGHGALAEELAGKPFRGQAEADRLAGVGDRGHAEDGPGDGIRLDVPEVGAVDLPAAHADDGRRVGVLLDGDLVRVEQVDLTGEQGGAGPVGDHAPGVPAQQQARHRGPQPVGQLGVVGRGAAQQRRQRQRIPLVVPEYREGKRAHAVGEQPDAPEHGAQPERLVGRDPLPGPGLHQRDAADVEQVPVVSARPWPLPGHRLRSC
jgi:hypothetical protein